MTKDNREINSNAIDSFFFTVKIIIMTARIRAINITVGKKDRNIRIEQRY